jgi:hypothetical protein
MFKRGRTRVALALGLNRNPLCRGTDRAQAWIRAGLLAVLLIAGPMAALGAGHWAGHMKITAVPVPAAPTHLGRAALQPPLAIADLSGAGQEAGAGSRARPGAGRSDARLSAVLAAALTLAAMALALMGSLRLAAALLTRRRLAAWDAAWSRVEPQWSRRQP